MGLLQRRTRLGQVLEAVGGTQWPAAVGSALAEIRPPKAVKTGLTAVAALTAGSAAVSALRRRHEDSRSDQ